MSLSPLCRPKRGWLLRRKRLFMALLAIPLAPMVSALIAWWLLPWLTPLPEHLSSQPNASPTIHDRQGKLLASLARDDYFHHTPTQLTTLPPALVEATLAAEDKRFYSHGGIDLLANLRAIYQNIKAGRVVSGASTITQQTVKLASGTPPRTLPAKLIEALQARRLEMTWSKEQILTAYFDRLDYGNHRLGPEAAAQFYFDCPVHNLSVSQAAMLAGLPQAPSRHNPLRNPEQADKRRAWVLERRFHLGQLSAPQYQRARSEPLSLRTNQSTNPALHLTELLRRQPHLTRIDTTIDARLQTHIQDLATKHLNQVRANNAHHTAALVIDNASGDILAMLGSGNFHSPNGGQINAIFTPRSPGSVLKPLLYLLAFQTKPTEVTRPLADTPTQYRSAHGVEAPSNYDHRHYGPVTPRFALGNSLNIAAMAQLNALDGPKPFYQFLENFGCQFPQPPEHYGLGLAIGNAEVTLIQVANAFLTLANQGKPPALRLTKSALPSLELRLPKPPAANIDPAACWLIADILSDPQARTQAFGHQSALNLPFPCAVKTGTSSDFHDNWCVGFTADHTIAVWLGNFDHRPMRQVSGVTGAAPLFHEIAQYLHQQYAPSQSLSKNSITRHNPLGPPPPELTRSLVDTRNGYLIADLLASPEFPANSLQAHAKPEWHFTNNPPPTATRDHYSPDHRALLDPTDYLTWFEQTPAAQRQHLALADSPLSPFSPRITSPIEGTTFLIDPDIPGPTHLIPLRTNLPIPAQEIHWSSPTLKINSRTQQLILQPGAHQITATPRHPDFRTPLTTTITVRSL